MRALGLGRALDAPNRMVRGRFRYSKAGCRVDCRVDRSALPLVADTDAAVDTLFSTAHRSTEGASSRTDNMACTHHMSVPGAGELPNTS